MTDNGMLAFPDGEDDAELAERIAQAHRNLPAASPDAAINCTQAVLEQAAKRRGFQFGLQQRWWWGGAAAAALVLAFSMRNAKAPSADQAADTTLVGNITKVDDGSAVQFEVHLPRDAEKGADKVSVVGDFNGWDASATPMAQKSGKGAWSAKVPLPPGRHVYAYVINGDRWVVDPLAPQVPDAGYGPANALVVEGGSK